MPSGTPAHTGNHNTPPPPPLCLPIRWNSLASITAMIRAVLSPKLTVSLIIYTVLGRHNCRRRYFNSAAVAR